jgi:hypothetical protein
VQDGVSIMNQASKDPNLKDNWAYYSGQFYGATLPVLDKDLVEAGFEYAFGELLGGAMSRIEINIPFKRALPEENINLASPARTKHIIAGDATGGGHAWFGSLKSFVNGITRQKSMFPVTWNHAKIMNAVSHVAVNNRWIQQTGRAGATLTRSGQPVRFVVEGVYENVKIRVITTSTDIITAFRIR